MNKRVNINFYLSKLSIKRTKYNSMKMIYWKKKSVNANSHCFVLFSTYLNSAAVLGRPNTRASWRWGNTEYSRPLSRGSRIPLIPLLLQLLPDWNLRDKVFPQCLAVHVCFFFSSVLTSLQYMTWSVLLIDSRLQNHPVLHAEPCLGR